MQLFQKRILDKLDPKDALPGRTDRRMQVADKHLVLGTPMLGPWPEGYETAIVAMGCFWGAEKFLWKIPGVYTTFVGYTGGYTPNPTYEEVCTQRTGHAEAAAVVFDPAKVSYDEILKVFWENHDPTTPNRQGGDIGTQYRSALFVASEKQRAEAEASLARYQAELDKGGFGKISTEVVEAGPFYYAEPYHQQYLHSNPYGYCNHGFCQVGYPGVEKEPRA
ncbi:MAG: peptide-methionine (S)-S-oxide reductase MsrA [Dehalococcoidia bacterium]